jgi:hypothetical protein
MRAEFSSQPLHLAREDFSTHKNSPTWYSKQWEATTVASEFCLIRGLFIQLQMAFDLRSLPPAHGDSHRLSAASTYINGEFRMAEKIASFDDWKDPFHKWQMKRAEYSEHLAKVLPARREKTLEPIFRSGNWVAAGSA